MATQEVGLRCENFVVGFKVEARRVGPWAAASQRPLIVFKARLLSQSVCH